MTVETRMLEGPLAGRTMGARLAFPALLLGCAALAFGPLFVRLTDVNAASSAFWRLALAVLPLMLLARAARQPLPPLKGRGTALLALAGLFFALDLATWHAGIARTALANAALFGNIASFVFAIYGFVIIRQWPGRLPGAALLLAASGTALLLGQSAELSPRHLAGDLLCILGGLFYAGYLITMDHMRGQLAAVPALVSATAFGALALLPMALVSEGRFWPGDWGPILLLALGSQLLGQGLLIYAIGHLRPIVSGLGLLIQPVIAATLGWLWFGETLGPVEFAGALMVLVALALVRLPQSKGARR